MAEVKAPISSAVILPDTDPEASSTSLPPKRRRSSASESTTKRPRLSEDARSQSPAPQNGASKSPTVPSAAEPPSKPSVDRRKASVQEERKRGQRLFGGLLNTLSQSAPNNQNKRRLEIEKRQQERAKQQKAVDEGRRAEKLANLKAVRRAEQIKFDEQSMKIRHSNMLAMANFLSTKTEPKLYYKPWELLPAEEALIKQQLIDTQALVEQELRDFKQRHPKAAVGGSTEKANGTSSLETVGEPHAAFSSVSAPTNPNNSSSVVVAADTTTTTTTTTTPTTTNPPLPLQAEAQSDEIVVDGANAQEEHNGEVLVENDEDTVIY